jgi:Ca2+-binding EF-hand superfamily protein
MNGDGLRLWNAGDNSPLQKPPIMRITLSLMALLFAASTAVGAETEKPAEGKKKRDPEAQFKRLDADADGAVSKEEWNASRPAKKDPERAAKAFTAKDKDGDGKLTKEEFAAEWKRRK